MAGQLLNTVSFIPFLADAEKVIEWNSAENSEQGEEDKKETENEFRSSHSDTGLAALALGLNMDSGINLYAVHFKEVAIQPPDFALL